MPESHYPWRKRPSEYETLGVVQRGWTQRQPGMTPRVLVSATQSLAATATELPGPKLSSLPSPSVAKYRCLMLIFLVYLSWTIFTSRSNLNICYGMFITAIVNGCPVFILTCVPSDVCVVSSGLPYVVSHAKQETVSK
jgi:hypothetical protein